jgi:hypothetical protein
MHDIVGEPLQAMASIWGPATRFAEAGAKAKAMAPGKNIY